MSSANLMDTSEDITEDSAKWFDLNPNRDLLDPHFEGYKLSLEAFSQYKLELTDHQLDTSNLTDDDAGSNHHKMLLFQHLKLIGLQNLLVVNHFDDSGLYYFDCKFRLCRIVYKSGTNRAIVPTDLQLQGLSVSKSNRVNVTMKFINATTAVIFDGYETIYIAGVDQSDHWTQLFQFSTKNLEKFGVACILKDALLMNSDSRLHLLFMNMQEKSEDSAASFDTLINWLMFEKDAETGVWNLKRLRRLNCSSSVPDYVALETNGQSVYLGGPDFIQFEFDSVTPVKPQVKPNAKITKEEETSHLEPVEKFYTWNQTVNEINLNVRVLDSSSLNANDLVISLQNDRIEIVHQKSNTTIISDKLFSFIKPEESTWIVNPASYLIELTLTKANTEVWPCCLRDMEKFGEYKYDEKMIIEETKNARISWEETQNLYRLEQQLEECDAIEDEPYRVSENGDKMLMFRRMDGDLHIATHKTSINDNKFLFDVHLSGNKSPALCLRHDVDGVLWQPHRLTSTDTTETVWLTHSHTFPAFGYVQASKTNTKFRSCAPNCSYVCVVDTNKHAYVYKSVAAETQLKNRKSGKMINHVAKQFLISLDSDDEVYGVYCANDYLVLLLGRGCYLYRINPE